MIKITHEDGRVEIFTLWDIISGIFGMVFVLGTAYFMLLLLDSYM